MGAACPGAGDPPEPVQAQYCKLPTYCIPHMPCTVWSSHVKPQKVQASAYGIKPADLLQAAQHSFAGWPKLV